MKNYIARTFLLTLIVAAVLLGLHWLPAITIDGHTMRRVNMLADIEAEEPEPEAPEADEPEVKAEEPVKETAARAPRSRSHARNPQDAFVLPD